MHHGRTRRSIENIESAVLSFVYVCMRVCLFVCLSSSSSIYPWFNAIDEDERQIEERGSSSSRRKKNMETASYYTYTVMATLALAALAADSIN